MEINSIISYFQLASLVTRSLKRNNNVPYASSWLERLRSIKRLRQKILDYNRNDAGVGGNSGGMGMGASDHHHHAGQHQQSTGGVRKYQMDDFTTYTQ